jgi:hypothetical protein
VVAVLLLFPLLCQGGEESLLDPLHLPIDRKGHMNSIQPVVSVWYSTKYCIDKRKKDEFWPREKKRNLKTLSSLGQIELTIVVQHQI